MKLVPTLLLLLFVLALAPALSAAPAPDPSAPACPAAPAAPISLALAGVTSPDKCASCNDQFRACKQFCGTNNPIFSCQGSNPCAATCICP